jgi:hypothetical protein
MEALAKVDRHPNIVRVHTSGVERGRPWYVMELVRGRTLHDRLRHGPLPPREGAAIVRDLARAVAHIHAAGVLHRDLKPSNVLVRDEDGSPVLTDFGLAHLSGDPRLTHSHETLGTPAFMSPEQALGRTIDPRTDVYGLGAILYAVVAGRAPVEAAGPQIEVVRKVAEGELTPLRAVAPEVPPDLVAIVETALSRSPDARQQTPLALARDLERFLGEARSDLEQKRGEVERASRRRRLALAAVAACAALAVAPFAIQLGRDELESWRAGRREESERARAELVKGELARRAEQVDSLVSEEKIEEAIGVVDGAPAEIERLGGSRESAPALVSASPLAVAAARALEARAAGRLARAGAEASLARQALDDLDRAAAILPRGKAAAASSVQLRRSDALAALGDDEGSCKAIEAALAAAQERDVRARICARLALARLATGGVEAAAGALGTAPEGASGEAKDELAAARADVDLVKGEVERARSDLDALSPSPPPGAAAAAIELHATLDRARPRETVERAEALARAIEGRDPKARSGAERLALARARLALGLARSTLLEPARARAALESALEPASARGGFARVIRFRARTALVRLARRERDLDSARRLAAELVADAPREPWASHARVEAARTALAAGDLIEARAQLDRASAGPAAAQARAWAGALVRERCRRRAPPPLLDGGVGGAAPWLPCGVPAEEAPGDPQLADDTLATAREALAVARAAIEEARAQARPAPRRDLRAALDYEGQWSDARRAFRERGFLAWLKSVVESSAPARTAAEAARKQARPWLELARDGARATLDEDPDEPEALEVLVEATLALDDPVGSDDARALAQRAVDASRSQGALAGAGRLAAGPAKDPAFADALVEGIWLDESDPDAFFEKIRVLQANDRLRAAYDELFDHGAAYKIHVDPLLVEPYLKAFDRSPPRFGLDQVRVFFHAFRQGDWPSLEIAFKGEEQRRTIRELVASIEGEPDFEWGDPRARIAAHPFPPERLRRQALPAIEWLLEQAWADKELRAQLLWRRGIARLAANDGGGALDLAEAAGRWQEKAGELPIRIEDAFVASPDAAERTRTLEEALGRLGAREEAEPWPHLARGALVAARVHYGGRPVERAEQERAVDDLRKALERDPGLAAAHLLRGFLLASLGRADDAAIDVAAALAIAPQVGEVPDSVLGLTPRASFVTRELHERARAAQRALELRRGERR